ncbi:MAG: Nif3-like dinuclear metal center hexameric protein [Deltaproteobacteria bacterium]|nr:Nif3-like dinuclear metal center hexameric protein [Deltaproteobacteria bacterium]MBW2520069.1 Nif3-like dinuclear metal center hexameric protein [Deltaproteobacteria bacterium]
MANQVHRIQDLIGLIHALYPPMLAEEWDNVGLQVGDPKARLDKVLIALDPTLGAVHAAAELGAQALLTHHPLLFKPLTRLSREDTVGDIVWTAVEKNIAIISAHTNLDSAADGLNAWLADTLGILDSQPLQPAKGDYLKLVVYVPFGHEAAVSEALFSGGAGHIGAYDHCSFRTAGTGTFRPGEGTSPFSGEIGRTEQADEYRLETIVPRARLSQVLDKLIRAHPYEEIAYDVFPLLNQAPKAGLGRIGRLQSPTSMDAFVDLVKDALCCNHLRVSGHEKQTIRKVAVCGGSGAALAAVAKFRGADILVTGDVKYHDARNAEDLGIGLIDAGHFATERLMTTCIRESLTDASRQRGWDIDYHQYLREVDPFRIY